MTTHTTTFVNMLYSREFLFEGQEQPKTRAVLVCVGAEPRVLTLTARPNPLPDHRPLTADR